MHKVNEEKIRRGAYYVIMSYFIDAGEKNYLCFFPSLKILDVNTEFAAAVAITGSNTPVTYSCTKTQADME